MLKKNMLIGILTVALAFSFSGNAFAYSVPQRVRVGLESKFKEKPSIAINNGALTFGFELGGYFSAMGTVYASSGFAAEPANHYYVATWQTYNTYDQAASAAAFTGMPAAAAYSDSGLWQVYIGGFASKPEADNAAAMTGGSVVYPNNRRVVLKDGGRDIIVFECGTLYPQFMDSNGGDLKLSDRSYRGVIEFGRYQGAQLTAVNVLGLDEYLFSAVPSEMPSQWHLEALKAQAVAARSYTLTRLGVHDDSGYGLCDGQHCQVYLGSGNEAASTTQAVNETAGLVATYDGKPINAVFCSSSGGMTENSENVWTETVPYLRGVPEVAEAGAKEWVRAFTLNDITTLLIENGVSIGQATGVSAVTDPSTGRVSQLIISGTGGSHTVKKGEVRSFFQSSAGGSLESTNFTLASGAVSEASAYVTVQSAFGTQEVPVSGLTAASLSHTAALSSAVIAAVGATRTVAATQTAISSGLGSDVVFSGRGWGHGVGMSQFGAKGMAEAGYTYEQILKHYYTGIRLER